MRSKLMIVEPGGAQVSERAARVVGGVRAAEPLQLAVVEGLRAEARAVDARRAQRTEAFGVTVPGFISSVTSARASTSKRLRTASSTRATCGGVSREGVPPPK